MSTKAQAIKYYYKNRETRLKYARGYYSLHKAEKKEYDRDNRKNKNSYLLKYLKENPEKAREYRLRNRTKRLKVGFLAKGVIQRVYEDNIKKYGTLTCVLCNKPIYFGDDTIDHLTPISRGGTNDYDNLGIAHGKCNNRKYTKTLSEWFS